METSFRLLSIVAAVLIASAAGAEPTPPPAKPPTPAPAASAAAPDAKTEAAPSPPVAGTPATGAATVAPTPGPRIRPTDPRTDPGDGVTLRHRTQRQKIERAAKTAADDLAWIREQREALAAASKGGERDPRDVDFERKEKVVRARITALRERFDALTTDLEKKGGGRLPASWSPTLDCPACP